jgi:hypothetical protein
MCTRRLIVAIACSLLIPPATAMAHAQSAAPQRDTSDADGSETTAVDGRWLRTIRKALVAEKFDDLKAMAAQYRTAKSRVPGGDWQLHRSTRL